MDLRNTPVYFLTGEYGFLDRIPDSIIRVTAGGPGIGSHTPPFVSAKLHDEFLILDFDVPLAKGPEFFTIELHLGFNSATIPDRSTLPLELLKSVSQDKSEGILTSPPDAPPNS